MIEAGYERDSLHPVADAIRWWVYLEVEGGRNQVARRGVVDRGFRFARGGRASTAEEAEKELELARAEAIREWQLWRHQPSHALGPNGELIPLDEVPLELAR